MAFTLITFGTRPEYIKVLSLINHLPSIKTLYVGQHTNLLSFIKDPDYIIRIPPCDPGENRLNSIISHTSKFIFDPNIKQVLVQGDTTAAFAIALTAFNQKIPVIHLEAGLRTHDITNPFPEELNRQLISRIASIHLCPTYLNRQNLLNEGISKNIYVVGNTGLDNINLGPGQGTGQGTSKWWSGNGPTAGEGTDQGTDPRTFTNTILITMHRRDNFDLLEKWFITLNTLAQSYPDIEFIFPMHPNPYIQQYKHILENVEVIEPVSHDKLIEIIKSCKFVISDSGGIQEECAFLGKRIIICRKSTERPEILENYGVLCGEPEDLLDIFGSINENYIIDAECPFGDGRSWMKIAQIIV